MDYPISLTTRTSVLFVDRRRRVHRQHELLLPPRFANRHPTVRGAAGERHVGVVHMCCSVPAAATTTTTTTATTTTTTTI